MVGSYWIPVTEPAPSTAAGLESDTELAVRLATETGERLVTLRRELFDAALSPWDVMDHGDLAASHYIASQLREHRPDDAVLNEEAPEDPRRFGQDRVWIIDPLDGTREFGEHGRSDWAVHVALWDGDRFGAGAVALPALDVVMATEPPEPMPAVDRDRPRLVTSRYRAPYAAAVVGHALDGDAIRMGSAGAKAMSVVLGHADIYLHDGGMYQWDSAAPVAVAQAAGFHTSRVDGSPLVYNQPSPWLPDVLICRPELADRVLTALWG